MSTIIKAYITRNVATLYVPSKTTNKANQNKPIFKMTPFYSCIEGKFFFIMNKSMIKVLFFINTIYILS